QRARDDHHVRLPRRGARRDAEALRVVARYRHVHHLYRAARETEGHPHQRAGARPGDQRLGRSNEKALVGKLLVPFTEGAVVGTDRLAGARVEHAPGLGSNQRGGGIGQSHSSAPFFHSYIKPIVSTPRNTIIDQKPSQPTSPKETAHGNRKATSRSKMMNRIETR